MVHPSNFDECVDALTGAGFLVVPANEAALDGDQKYYLIVSDGLVFPIPTPLRVTELLTPGHIYLLEANWPRLFDPDLTQHEFARLYYGDWNAKDAL
jgi:hypothetical protein